MARRIQVPIDWAAAEESPPTQKNIYTEMWSGATETIPLADETWLQQSATL